MGSRDAYKKEAGIMYFSSFSSFIHMGGYADYVWSAFAIAIVMLFINSVMLSSRLRKMIKILRDRYARSS